MTFGSEPPRTRRLDNRRPPCAIGLVRAQRTMRDLKPGWLLETLTRDRFAPTEVRLWAERDGHRVRQVGRGGVWPSRYHRSFLVEKPAA